ncbi:MAG: pantetheine-phosphate adenylyltransferase [Oscillospiraceae bacterium]
MKTAIYPGSFDPITLGHLDIIRRSAPCFDRLFVCVMVNCDKKPMFSPEQRLELIRRSVADLPNVEAELYSGLLADYARQKGAGILVKGVRNTTDFDLEYQQAAINRGICPELETLLARQSGLSALQQHYGAGDDPVRPAFGKICSRPGGGGTEREVNLMEEKDVQRLLDMLYSMIDEAKSAAFSSDKCVISRDEALDLLDDIRAKLPLEIKKAQELVRAREEYVSSAKKEVEKMLRQAELDAKVIVSESETLQQARRKSSEIIRRAEERSKELYHVANTYTEDALRRTEEAIQAALDEVKESRVRFRATSNEQMQANQEKLRERRSASEQPQSDENA